MYVGDGDCAFKNLVNTRIRGMLTVDNRVRAKASVNRRNAPHYVPLLRPASEATLPAGIQWLYAEAPWDLVTRPDLPRSGHQHGVIATSRALTREECERFSMRFLGALPAAIPSAAADRDQPGSEAAFSVPR
jgi:hypothetical protein